MKIVTFISVLFATVLCGCGTTNQHEPSTNISPHETTSHTTVSLTDITANSPPSLQLLPEKAVTKSETGNITAFYAMPTREYAHGILADAIEAKQLVFNTHEKTYLLTLGADHVFEDIKPRLYDVDNDGELEIITIRTHVNKGAGIAIYKLVHENIIEFAYVADIGRKNRWLNIASIADLDQDGTVDIAWIQTPHIGGRLKVARITQGKLTPLDEKSFYSNHAMGDNNLCLSVLTKVNNHLRLYVPAQFDDSIIGFEFKNNKLLKVSEFAHEVDYAKPLTEQYDFGEVIYQSNCR